MAYDTLIMKAITAELKEKLTGAVVQKVSEPGSGEILLNLYHQGRQFNLLFSVDAKFARIHLTGKDSKPKSGSLQPSSFCMLLRKYLTGSRIDTFSNPPLERIMIIAFAPPDALPPVTLVAEIMGRRSNLILIDADMVILGAARIVSWVKNPLRAIYPGEKYRPVPAQNKLNPLQMSTEELAKDLLANLAETGNAERALAATVAGISPLIACELLFRSRPVANPAQIDPDRLAKTIRAAFIDVNSGRLKAELLPARQTFAALPLTHLPDEDKQEWASFNKMLDRFYSDQVDAASEKDLKLRLQNAVRKKLKALQRKDQALRCDLKAAEQAPQYRLYGELLLAYGDQVPRGSDSALLPDHYNPGRRVTVPLNPARSAAANAKYYFNRYRKAKTGRDMVLRQLKITALDADYCQELLYSIESSSGILLTEIEQELIEAGYLRNRKKVKHKEGGIPKPQSFNTSSGKTLLVGRNNRQNDFLTFKAAVRRDIWFHARQLPGSHVVLKETTWPPFPDDRDEAAFLAAYFSKGRDGRAVSVDYTEIRHVRRQPGGKPGLVFYENYETITVNPLDQRLKQYFGL